MPGLSEQKRAAVARLIEAAPDAMLLSIEAAFRNATSREGEAVWEAAEAERVDRAARALTFEPVLPLFTAREDAVRAPVFPSATLKALWAEVGQRRPDAVAILAARVRSGERDPPSPILVDGLCAEAAALLREGDPGRWSLTGLDPAESLAAYFDLVPLARAALQRLHEWLGRMDAERAAALRLAFKDAARLREDGAARLLELLMGHLPRAGQVLRLIAAMTDGAGEGFIHDSELADFGERLVEFVEVRSRRLQTLDRLGHADEARAAVMDLEAAIEVVAEFEMSVPQAENGLWSRRLAASRRVMNDQLEAILRRAEKLVDKALPLTSTRIAGRMSRLAPDLKADPAAPAAREARAALTVLYLTRGLAAEVGCESLRQQVADAVAAHADSYAEEVLQALHGQEIEDTARASALLELAAEFLGLSRDERAAALVRRRAAVALSGARPSVGDQAA